MPTESEMKQAMADVTLDRERVSQLTCKLQVPFQEFLASRRDDTGLGNFEALQAAAFLVAPIFAGARGHAKQPGLDRLALAWFLHAIALATDELAESDAAASGAQVH